jgi:uncharacterized protein
VTETQLRTSLVSAPDEVALAWGDRVVPEAPPFRLGQHTAKAASGQVGLGIDRLGILHLSSTRALLVAAHAHGPGQPTLLGDHDDTTVAKISMATHGLSVVTLRRGRRSGRWVTADPARAPHNRRIHGGTLCKLTGPVAGDRRLRTAGDTTGRLVMGTFGHSVGTLTPWGAALSAEGGFASYFDASGAVDATLRRSFARYGLGPDGPGTDSGRGWSAVDSRFDLSQEPAEAFRHGWVVLVDPRRPSSRPRKLTMLGRLAHTGMRARIADDGRAVIRLRDGHLGGHAYVYVSHGVVDHGTGPVAGRHNRRLLTTGTLHLVLPGRRADDPTAWVPLTTESTSYVDGLSVAGVLLDTRLATERLLG